MAAFLLFAADVIAQVPQGFNFQAVARDAGGDPIINTELGVRVTVLQGTEEGTAVYTEVQSPTTSAVGSFQIVIGEGTSEGDFGSIDWSADNYYVKLEVDPAGGEEYEELGTTRLLSVPYALLAKDVVNGSGSGSGTPLELSGTNGNMNVNIGNTGINNNYGFLELGDDNGDALARLEIPHDSSGSVGFGRLRLTNKNGNYVRLFPNNLYFDNSNIETVAPLGWFGTIGGNSGFSQLLAYNAETSEYQGGILTGHWPGQPTIMMEDGSETPLVILEAQKHEDRNIGVLTLRGTDGTEFSITSDGIDGSSSGSATQYNLNTSEGDTSFSINAEGSGSILGALQVRSQTDGSNRGVDSRVFSSAGNEASQLGVYGRVEGSGTGNHFGVYGLARGDEGVSGSRYGTFGWAESSGRYNFGLQAVARGVGSGEIVAIGDEQDGFFGSFNIGGGFYPSGNINGNTGIDVAVSGSEGERINIGGEFRVFTEAAGGNTGVNVFAKGSQKENIGFFGVIDGQGVSNRGMILHVNNGTSNIGLDINADTAAILNGFTEINGDLKVNGTITETSDRNLKENIQPLQNGLNTIMKLNPATYNFRGNGEYKGLKLSTGLHYGLIAQEVEEVLPSLVSNNFHSYKEVMSTSSGPDATSETEATKTMEYKTMNYTELIPVLIKGMQEQQELIKELQKEIEELKKNN